MTLYSQLWGIVILNISYLTIFYNYTFLLTVLCRPTLLYKCGYVENSTAVISLIDYKNRDKFPFYPNNTPKSLSKATKKTIYVVLTYNDYLCNILILTYTKTKESFAQDKLVFVFKEIVKLAFYHLQIQKYIYISTLQNTSLRTKNSISQHPHNSIIINKLQNKKVKGA